MVALAAAAVVAAAMAAVAPAATTAVVIIALAPAAVATAVARTGSVEEAPLRSSGQLGARGHRVGKRLHGVAALLLVADLMEPLHARVSTRSTTVTVPDSRLTFIRLKPNCSIWPMAWT
jgi:hypothetical protein